MHSLILFLAFVSSTSIVLSIPVSQGHLNAHSDDFGMSVVDIEKDVILSAGKGGNNFNAQAENNGQSVVSVGGTVQGFGNRTGQEFNAISRKHGISQVRVKGNLLVGNFDPSAKKFDAIAESNGQSLVQLGNVMIMAGSRGAKSFNTREVNNKVQTLESPWGAAAVADHNSKPWETVNHGPVSISDSSIVHDTTAEDATPHDPNSSTAVPVLVPAVPHPTEIVHEPSTPIVGGTDVVTSEKPIVLVPSPVPTAYQPESVTHHNVTVIDGNSGVVPNRPSGGYSHSVGSLNAISKGHGSKAIVQVKGFVQY